MKVRLRVVMLAGLLLSMLCTRQERKKAFLYFVDYSRSASSLVGANRGKVNDLVDKVLSNLQPEDLLAVYPIHAYTASATPILRLSGPKLLGDLRDRQRQKSWQREVAGSAMDGIWKVRFREDRTSWTNIYPIVHKIARSVKTGYKVRAFIICDMIQDANGEDFSKMFGNNSDADPIRYARRKVSELGFEGILEGVEIMIKMPGSPQGIKKYDHIRPKVTAFWEEFYSTCGARVTIEDL